MHVYDIILNYNKMKRITVSDIKPILSLAKNSELYISEPTSLKIFFV